MTIMLAAHVQHFAAGPWNGARISRAWNPGRLDIKHHRTAVRHEPRHHNRKV
jgi:hypothetical protein